MMPRPPDFEHDIFMASDATIENVRVIAGRMAVAAGCPVRIHRHPYSAPCDGFRHEHAGSVSQLRLAGFDLPAGVGRERF